MLKTGALAFLLFTTAAFAQTGTTVIAKWRDNKDGAFTLQFDDCPRSQAEKAVPEVLSRNIEATWYYICACAQTYPEHHSLWSTLPSKGQELAAHTMTHQSATTYSKLDYEMGECARIVRTYYPPQKANLLSFCTPGGVQWGMSESRMRELYIKHHLVHRKDSPCVENNSAEQLFEYAQIAIDNKEWGSLCFHGISGDWLSNSIEELSRFMDKLIAVKDRLWICSNIRYHKYSREREISVTRLLASSDREIQITLTFGEDTAYYDEPLTLITTVPSAWQYCLVRQGAASKNYAVVQGKVQYEAVPGAQTVFLTKSGPTAAMMARGPESGLVFPRGRASFNPMVHIYDLRGRRVSASQLLNLDDRKPAQRAAGVSVVVLGGRNSRIVSLLPPD